MIARRGYRASRPAAWLAAFAILLQALLLPAGQHLAAATPAGLGGDTVAGLDIALNLCHAAGDTTPDDPGKAPLDHEQCCALCLAAHAIGGFTPPAAPVVAVSRDYGIVVPAETALVLPAQRSSLRQQQPRAPPVFI
jgi:hypothetical protein